jgi:hypothetical protein
MSINKSQGQTLGHVGLFLPRPMFTHEQIYIVVSRVRTCEGLKILITDESQQSYTSTVNVVYPEVFQKIYNQYIYIYEDYKGGACGRLMSSWGCVKTMGGAFVAGFLRHPPLQFTFSFPREGKKLKTF